MLAKRHRLFDDGIADDPYMAAQRMYWNNIESNPVLPLRKEPGHMSAQRVSDAGISE